MHWHFLSVRDAEQRRAHPRNLRRARHRRPVRAALLVPRGLVALEREVAAAALEARSARRDEGVAAAQARHRASVDLGYKK